MYYLWSLQNVPKMFERYLEQIIGRELSASTICNLILTLKYPSLMW